MSDNSLPTYDMARLTIGHFLKLKDADKDPLALVDVLSDLTGENIVDLPILDFARLASQFGDDLKAYMEGEQGKAFATLLATPKKGAPPRGRR